MTADTLDCCHCGDVAVTSETGRFGEGDADRCETCGIPGQVIVDEPDDDGNASAHWYESEDGRCNQADCSECK